MNVLLLEDEYLLNNNIKDFLELKGAHVESYVNGAVLLNKSNFDADIAILDIEVPGADGYEVIEWIRRMGIDMPILFITAYTDIESIKKAYTLGCSDYLKKPFDLFELWLRIQKLLGNDNNMKIRLHDNVVFDMEYEQLYVDDKIRNLTKIQRGILKQLIKHKNAIVEYDAIIFEVWDNEFVKINTIATHVKEIRRHLPGNIIESIRSEGYRLNLK